MGCPLMALLSPAGGGLRPSCPDGSHTGTSWHRRPLAGSHTPGPAPASARQSGARETGLGGEEVSGGTGGCPGRPLWVPRVCPKCLPMTISQSQTFRKHVAHVQHSHKVVDITVDALGHTRVLQGDRRVSQGHGVRPWHGAPLSHHRQLPSHVPPAPTPWESHR